MRSRSHLGLVAFFLMTVAGCAVAADDVDSSGGAIAGAASTEHDAAKAAAKAQQAATEAQQQEALRVAIQRAYRTDEATSLRETSDACVRDQAERAVRMLRGSPSHSLEEAERVFIWDPLESLMRTPFVAPGRQDLRALVDVMHSQLITDLFYVESPRGDLVDLLFLTDRAGSQMCSPDAESARLAVRCTVAAGKAEGPTLDQCVSVGKSLATAR